MAKIGIFSSFDFDDSRSSEVGCKSVLCLTVRGLFNSGNVQDVLKALAMGATGTYIGRAFVYGLGAMGQDGVTKALEVIHKELDISMALCGRRNVQALDKSVLMIPEDFAGRWQA